VDLKYLAQRAFISYVRFVHNAPDKTVFDVRRLDLDGLAESFGMMQKPVMELRQRAEGS
jgi:ATP-dependent RNA helicase DDX10/DBP4